VGFNPPGSEVVFDYQNAAHETLSTYCHYLSILYYFLCYTEVEPIGRIFLARLSE
jgi:hypothetical protein